MCAHRELQLHGSTMAIDTICNSSGVQPEEENRDELACGEDAEFHATSTQAPDDEDECCELRPCAGVTDRDSAEKYLDVSFA